MVFGRDEDEGPDIIRDRDSGVFGLYVGMGGGATFSGEKRDVGAVTTRWRDDGVGREVEVNDGPEMIGEGASAKAGEGEKTTGGFGGGAGGGEDAFAAASVAAFNLVCRFCTLRFKESTL